MSPATKQEPITLVVAGHDAELRRRIAEAFRPHGQYSLVAECSGGNETLHTIVARNPDMALLDADHPDVPALQMMRRVHAVSPRTKLLFLSSRRDYRVVQDFLNGGADGYLLKDDDSRCFVDAVNSVNDGWQYVSPTIRNELVNAVRRVSNPLKRLTEREAEVYRLLVEGMRPKDIATTMGISPKTVDTHRANLMRKLGVQSIASLVRFAMLHEPGISRGRV